MNSLKTAFLGLLASLAMMSCSDDTDGFDASGTFEAEEVIISSEANGVLKQFKIDEGQTLASGEFVGYIDTVQLHLKRKQLEAQYRALLGKKPNINIQLAALESQLSTAIKERQRIKNLVEGDAATQKQLDDIDATIEVIQSQIRAQKSSLEITRDGISNDADPIFIQIEQIEDQLEKSKIINPIAGTVLAKYARENEMTATGKALYKIADLSDMILRVYISGNQFSQVKLNQKVRVLTDDGSGGLKETEGTISWINDKAEFTPKTIQTKDERANMVYAVKVNVVNDGFYKIGMYGEVKF
jgi:HlyD family secretion protein